MGTTAAPERYHALDALRAAMMFAVVVLHAAIPYSDVPAARLVFRFGDPDGGPGFFTLAVLLQSVSMPAFFLTAGFFAAMLAARRGVRAMLTHRLRRITLPFVVFWPPLHGLTLAGILLGCTVATQVTALSAEDAGVVLRHVGSAAASGTPLLDALLLKWPRPADELVQQGTFDGSEHGRPVWAFRGPGTDVGPAAWAAVRFVPVGVGAVVQPPTHHLLHLWFLWVLTLLVVLAAVVGPLAARLPTGWLGRRLDSFAFPLVAALPLSGAFAAYQLPALPPPPALLVPPATLFGYGLFFATGALLWRHRELLPRVGRRWPVHLGLGLAALVAAWSLTPQADWRNPDVTGARVWVRIGVSLLAAVGHWQLVWAVVGVFNRWATGNVPWVRYASDASYWVYLVHLPVVVWVAAVLLPWEVSRFVKFPIVLGTALVAPLLGYHLFVRGTFVGSFLNAPAATAPATPRKWFLWRTYDKSPKAPALTGFPGPNQ